MSRVTIEIDDELLSRAAELASARRMSVADMLHRLLEVVAAPAPGRSELPPHTRQAHGMLPAATDAGVERILDEERMRKHGT